MDIIPIQAMVRDPDTPPSTSPEHPIRVVCRRTGLKPDLLRAWERRYGAIQPRRSDTERRLYSDADIERVRLLVRALEGGRSIGQIGHLPTADIQRLIEQDRAQASDRLSDEATPENAEDVAPRLGACLRAARALDRGLLAQELDKAVASLSQRQLLEGLLIPLLHRIGDSWEQGNLRPVHEHMATALIRSTLGRLLERYRPPESAPRILVTTGPDQLHEIGALLVALTAAAEDWNATYLGPDLPLEDMVAASEETRATVLALSVTRGGDLQTQLEELRERLPASVTLIAGGRGVDPLRHLDDGTSLRIINDLEQLRQTLRRLAPGERD